MGIQIPGKRVGKRLQSIQRTNMATNAEMNSQMAERFNVAGALLVKLFGRPDEEAQAMATAWSHWHAPSQRAGRVVRRASNDPNPLPRPSPRRNTARMMENV